MKKINYFKKDFLTKANLFRIIDQFEEILEKIVSLIESLEPGMLIEDYFNVWRDSKEIADNIKILRDDINDSF